MRLKQVQLGLFYLALMSTSANAAPEAQLSIKDAADFVEQLREMGYAPDALDKSSPPTTVIHSNGSNYGVILGGCTKAKDCRYVVIYGVYTDVIDPPAAWVAEMNSDYDVIKVWVNSDRKLTYSVGLMADGMPRSTFRATFDMLSDSAADLANEVKKAKLPLTDGDAAKP